MADLWEDEGFGSAGGTPDAGGEEDWEEDDEGVESALEDAFDDPDEEDEEDWDGAEG